MSDNRTDINEYIWGLDYDLNQLKVLDGNSVDNYTPKSGELDSDKFIVVTREKHTVENDIDICVPASNKSVMYPGATVYVNENLFKGQPQALSASRGSVELMLDLPGMTSGNSIVVDEATYPNVNAAMEKILDEWFANYQDSCVIPADMSYFGSIVHDEKELQLRFGMDIPEKLGINMDFLNENKKSVFMAKFSQVFFSASVTPFAEPSAAFAESVTKDTLVKSGVNDSNPPGYVGAVMYGREIYIEFESDASQQDLDAAMKATLSGNGLSLEAEAKYKDVFNSTSFSLTAFGGDAKSFAGVFNGTDAINNINAIIFENTTLSRQNPAFPMSYKVACLKDNAVASVSASTEYVTETFEEFSNGTLTLDHDGAYVAKFTIEWDCLSYDEEGKENYTHNNWEGNGESKTAGFKTQIALTGDTRHLRIKAEGCTGLAWQWWTTCVDQRDVPVLSSRTLRIYGTTLNQKYSFDPSI